MCYELRLLAVRDLPPNCVPPHTRASANFVHQTEPCPRNCLSFAVRMGTFSAMGCTEFSLGTVDYKHSIAANDDPYVRNHIYPLIWYHVDVLSNLARLTAGDEWRLDLRADHSREREDCRHNSQTSKMLHVPPFAAPQTEALAREEPLCLLP